MLLGILRDEYCCHQATESNRIRPAITLSALSRLSSHDHFQAYGHCERHGKDACMEILLVAITM
jgi:hypothetical protein